MKSSASIAAALCVLSVLSEDAYAAPELREISAIGLPSAGSSAGLVDARGTPLAVAPILRWDARRVFDYLEGFGLESSLTRFGVDAYRIEYYTVDTDNAPTTASSLVALPRMDGSHEPMKQAIWLHGSTVYKYDAASLNEDSDDHAVVLALAAAGFLTTAPDYLGLGLGPGTHPYNHRASEVSASIDALRATRVLAAWLVQRAEPSLAISGFAEGGATALALARALTERPEPSLRVAALAPIAGAYSASEMLAAALGGELVKPVPYLAQLTVALNRQIKLYDRPTQAFVSPYDRLTEPLFDGEHTPEEVLNFLPERPEDLFTQEQLARLAQPNETLRSALLASDAVCDFRPSVVTHLYASSSDREVPFSNTLGCQKSLERHGATVVLHDLGELEHAETLERAVTQLIEQLAGVTR